MAGNFVDSHDPRVWAAAWQPSAPGDGKSPGLAARPGMRRLAIALAVVGVVGAGAAALLLRQAPPEQAAPQVSAPSTPAPPAQVRRTLVLAQASELANTLIESGLSADMAARIAAAATPGLLPGAEIRATLVLQRGPSGLTFERLEASNPDSSGIVVRVLATGEITTSQVAAQIEARIIVKHSTMDGDSFYSSAVSAGISNSVIPAFAKALAFDFDFQREVTAGDAFEAAYSQPVNSSGEPVGAPTLLFASLTTASKSASVYRFTGPGGEEEWFDSSGRSIVRSLMRTPVDGARVTSKFGMRFHPVLKFMKLHGGIDFAAPTGTPIYASGTGVVEFAGPKGANGNYVRLRHDNGWLTLYLHMNAFAPGIADGVRVTQGQQIGEVGTTGRSTGPHLHYEVHIDGEKMDPLSIQTDSSGRTLSGEELLAFEKVRDQIDVSRAQQSD